MEDIKHVSELDTVIKRSKFKNSVSLEYSLRHFSKFSQNIFLKTLKRRLLGVLSRINLSASSLAKIL